ncbi:MAG: tRNA-(ms[2]io[6]A)-hydroxylase [Saprospiraceae bacterium]|nr:tRNA-(ms[2]io[6]A)-hydroxylase [Saprospiraceae bacterium]
MLGLKLSTDPRWADLTAISIEAILTDHAYCEQKAALSMISLIQQYPEENRLVEELAPVVTEEWGHFRSVLAMLKKRNLQLGAQRRDEYVHLLKKFEKHGGSKNQRLVEKLLICALIEARSCERFRILSLHHPDEELKTFYHKFMVSEAGHYRMFIDLANEYGEREQVKSRWNQYLEYEAGIMTELALRGDRVH